MAHFYPIIKAEFPKIVKGLIGTLIADAERSESFKEFVKHAFSLRMSMIHPTTVEELWSNIAEQGDGVVDLVFLSTTHILFLLQAENITLDVAIDHIAKGYAYPIRGTSGQEFKNSAINGAIAERSAPFEDIKSTFTANPWLLAIVAATLLTVEDMKYILDSGKGR